MATPSRITALLSAQGEALARLQDREARNVLRLTEDARREMREALERLVGTGGDEKTPYTAQHLRMMLAQAESTILTLRRRMDAEFTASAQTAGERALSDLLAVIRANEPEFRDVGGRVELRALTRMSRERGLLLHRYSIDRYGAEVVEAIQRELSVGLVRGLSIPEVTRRIAGTSGVFQNKAYRAELIARMETNSVYNRMHTASLQEAAAELDEPDRPDPLMKRADEYIDHRSHPFSAAIEGKLAKPADPWRVPAAEVAAAGARLGKRITGIVVPLVGSEYVGVYPMHFGERGRGVPHRSSW